MPEWINQNKALLTWLTVAGVVMFVAALVFVPARIVRIPADYFAHETRPPSVLDHVPLWLRIPLRIGKNLLGVALIIAGLAMLVLPGQGLLTALMGVLLLEIPGKYRLERWAFAHPRVQRPLNWLRKRAHREPLRVLWKGRIDGHGPAA